jgi:PEP-CTERM motif
MPTKTRLLAACAAAGLLLCVSAPASATKNVCGHSCSNSFTSSVATANLTTTSNQNVTTANHVTGQFKAAIHSKAHAAHTTPTVTPAVVPSVVIDPIDQALLDAAGSDFFGATRVAMPGAFTDTFDFFLTNAMAADSSIITKILDSNDIDFTSIFLDGYAFTQTGFDPASETWDLSPVALAAGTHTITVNGSVVGRSGNGSYSGVLNVAHEAAAVPEPTTWAATLLGFGFLGFSMRRRRRKSGILTQFA